MRGIEIATAIALLYFRICQGKKLQEVCVTGNHRKHHFLPYFDTFSHTIKQLIALEEPQPSALYGHNVLQFSIRTLPCF